MILPGFVGPVYTSVSPNIATEKLQNLYPQSVEVPYEKARVVYLPTPGLKLLCTLPDRPVRGLFSQDGRTFGVGGASFSEINVTTGTLTPRGNLSAVDGNPTTINSSGASGHQLYITSGGQGNIFDTNTNTMSMIASNYPANTPMGTYLDSYFLTIKGASMQFNISAILDGTSWAALDFALRTAASDNLVGIAANNKVIWLFGSATSEPWYDSGAAVFPFQAVPQVLIPFGCCAPFSIVRATAGGNPTLCWLHQDERGQGIFVHAETYVPQRLSTFATEWIWSTYPTISDCVCYAYTDQGHEFVVLNFPSGNATWVYDFTENMWHQRSFWNVATGNDDRQLQWVHCNANGVHLVGDWKTGNVYIQSTTATTDADALIRRVRRSPHASSEQKFNFYSQFQLDLETGLGNIVAPGDNPSVLLQWSDDGGHTFNSGVQMSAGAQGQYRTRCMAHGNLGRSRDRVFQIVMSDPIPWRILQAYVTIAPGSN